jgi:hypothetical protein
MSGERQSQNAQRITLDARSETIVRLPLNLVIEVLPAL